MCRIACISDLHSFLPEVPECDMVLIAGDITWHSSLIRASRWLEDDFGRWAKNLGVPIYITPGNHDEVFQQKWLPVILPHNVHLLIDRWVIDRKSGLSIFGSPWTKTFNNWYFMKDQMDLEDHFNRVVPAVDIYVTHSPPYGYGDMGEDGHTGSNALLYRIEQYHPKLAIWGHLHSNHGQWRIGETLACNVSLIDEDYKPAYDVTMIEWDNNKMILRG